MSRFTKRFLALLPFVFVASLLAQEAQQIEFTVYGQYPIREDIAYMPIGEDALKKGIKEPEPIKIKTHSLTRVGPYTYRGGRKIPFIDSATGEIVAGVSLPSASKKWLFIFVKNNRYEEDPENNLKYKVYPFDDSLRNLPRNGLVFLNFSKMDLSGVIGDKKLKLDPGESKPFPVAPSLRIDLRTPDIYSSKMLPAHIKNYRFRRNHRYLMILFPPVLKSSADADVRFIAESLELPKEKQ